MEQQLRNNSLSAAAAALSKTLAGILVALLSWIVSKMPPWSGRKVDVRKKVVFITGCDSGFGFSMALHCRNNLGMAVVAACRCGHGRAGAKALREAGCTVLEEFDVTSDDCGPRAAAAAREAVGEDGELWCLVNNAAVLVFAEAEWQTPRQIDLQMKVNATAPLVLTQSLLPFLRRSGGRVVNLTSLAARRPLPYFSAYGASKAALEAASASMRIELRKHGVDVVLLEPGNAPGKTPLVGRQKEYHEEMISVLTSDERSSATGEHLRRCSAAICSMFGGGGGGGKGEEKNPAAISDDGFYRCFDKALTERNPQVEYMNHPKFTRARIFLEKVFTRERILERRKLDMVPLPKFEKKTF